MTALNTVRETIERESLASPSDRILVAFSGGADSTAMALILKSLGYDLVLGHVDHQMRPDSGADARHCSEVAARLGLPFLTSTVSVHPPTEAQAREVRYQALDSMGHECEATLIATGHTMDDQAETVVMRIDRGGFPKGIPSRRGRVIRPMLGLRRKETEAVCRGHRVDFLTDPSNADERFRRNFIRRQVMPDLAEVVPELSRLAVAAEKIAVRPPPVKVVHTRSEPVELPPVQVAVPGATQSAEWGLRIDAEILPAPADFDPDPNLCYLDADLVPDSLMLRQRRDGDRFFPLGMTGSKKLQDFLVDEKVPRHHRDRVPVFAAGSHIVWIAGYRIDQRYRLTAKSRESLRIRVFPLLRHQ